MKKPADTEDSCSTCVYWKEQTESADTERWGFCHRFPPVPVPSQTSDGEDTIDCVTAWTALPHFCGEHKPRAH